MTGREAMQRRGSKPPARDGCVVLGMTVLDVRGSAGKFGRVPIINRN